MNKNSIWEKYRNPKCKKCGLHKLARTVCLLGKGPTKADIMVINDYPNNSADKEGVPIAGKPSRLLNSMLKRANIDPSICYITNVVHCRAPETRKPTSKEIKTCYQYLEKEIEYVQPKYVLLLGAIPFKAVLKETGITTKHGQLIKKDGISYLPIFHPSYALRFPSKYRTLENDIKKFKRLTEDKLYFSPNLDLTIVNSFDDFNRCGDDLYQADEVSFDLETNTLNPKKKKAKITCLGLGSSSGKQYVIPFNLPGGFDFDIQYQMVDILREILEGKKVIAQNAKFDNKFLRQFYGMRFPVTFDTMLASHLLNENTPNGLKYLVTNLLNGPNYDIDKKTKQGKGDIQKLLKYNGYDVYYTLELYYKLKEMLLKDPVLARIFIKLIMPASDILEDIEHRGIYLNTKKFQEASKILQDQLKDIEEDLSNYKKGVNWNSPQQVAEFLYEDLELKIIETTNTGNPSTAENVLHKLQEEHPSIDKILEYRGVAKQYSTYIKGWKKRLHKGKLHPTYKLHGTVTYRLSCSNPNLQQTPRDPFIRSLIDAPPGWTFVEIDYSQVELRIAAILSGEETMREIFKEGEDIHTKTAQNILNKRSITKEERKQAKAVNFGFLYGMGAPKFRDYAEEKFGVELTLEEAKRYRAKFFSIYNDLPKWHEKQRRIAGTNKQVRTLLGRIRRLPDIESSNFGVRSEAERQAINSPVQSFASDLSLMSMIDIRDKIDPEKVKMVGQVHDAILFNIKDEYLYEEALKIKEIMEHPTLLDYFKINLPIPIIADVTIGPWGSGEELTKSELEERR